MNIVEIKTFEYEFSDVRVIVDDQGIPWFVAKDVCTLLGIKNVGNSLSDFPRSEVQLAVLNEGKRGNPTRSVVNESGVYRLIFRSRKPWAEKFKNWVLQEVIPTVRKTGQYPARVTPALPAPSASPLLALRDMVDNMIRLEDQQIALAQAQAATQERLHVLECKVQPEVEEFTIMGFNNLHRLGPLTLRASSILGLRATNLSKQMGYSVGKTTDPRFGQVNTYHVDILNRVFEQREILCA
jgi:prophage antirepressor-like protein